MPPYEVLFFFSSTFSATVAVTVTDRARNETVQPLIVVHDMLPPVLTVTAPPTVPVRFTVAWSGLDNAAGVRNYQVRYRLGAVRAWQDWLTDTLQTEAQFIGTPDAQYYFEVTATDNVNNSTVEQVGPVTVKSVTKYYTHGGQRVAMRRGAEVYFLHGDHLGSTSLTTDSSGAVVSEVRYLPYGEERWANGETPTDFGFTSQRHERGFGLYDYKARYYSPALGRFISPDSIVPEPGSSGGFNRYRYARNNPLKYVDPSGHCVFAGVDTAACILGATYVLGIAGIALTVEYTGVLDPAAEVLAGGIREGGRAGAKFVEDMIREGSSSGGATLQEPEPAGVTPPTSLGDFGGTTLTTPAYEGEGLTVMGIPIQGVDPGLVPNVLEVRGLTSDEKVHIGRISRVDVESYISKHPWALTEPPDGPHVIETEQLIQRLQKSVITLGIALPHLDEQSAIEARSALDEGMQKLQRVRDWFNQRGEQN